MRSALVIASLTGRPAPDGRELRRLPAAVGGLEVRADLTGDLEPAALRRHFSGELVYSLRSHWRGGRCADPLAVRHQRLCTAARDYDVVDLEADHDLVPAVLAAVPPHQRRISWHGHPLPLDRLRARFAAMAAVPARLYLLAPTVTRCEQALPPLRLLAELGRADLTGFGTGPAGTWSRLLAPWLGAPLVFGRMSPDHEAGVPTVDELLTDYPFPGLPPLDAVYGIVGRTALRSLSPRLHNAAYHALGLPYVYLPFQVDTPHAFRTGFGPHLGGDALAELGLPLRGLTVTAPHKEDALAMSASASPSARASGGANLLVREGTGWRGETTDATAVVTVLRRAGVPVAGQRAVVVGCGGAGRAAAAALHAEDALVTLVNRGAERGRFAAGLLGLPVARLDRFTPAGATVLVHATPVRDELPFDLAAMAPGAIVVDLVYTDRETPIAAAARRRGLYTVDGWEILTTEVTDQFRLLTGHPFPDTTDLTRSSAWRVPSTPR